MNNHIIHGINYIQVFTIFVYGDLKCFVRNMVGNHQTIKLPNGYLWVTLVHESLLFGGTYH